MKDKKNLDRLFQEQFKDFEENPPEIVWKNIEAQLNKKKKRRVIPLWYKLSGVAALLIFGFLGTRYFINQPKIETINPIVLEDNSVQKETENSNLNDNQNAVVIENKNKEKEADEIEKLNQNQIQLNDKNTVVSSDNQTKNDNLNTKSSKNNQINKTNNINSQQTELVTNSDKNSKSDKIFSEKENALVNSSNKNSKTDKLVADKENALVNSSDKNAKTDKLISDKEKGLANSTDKKSEINSLAESNVLKEKVEKENKSPFTLENQNEKLIEKIIDSASTSALTEAKTEPNTLGELLIEKEKEQKPKVEPKEDKWQISSRVAPVYLGSSSNGSPIDSQFANNTKDYQNTISYGVGVNYDINKKISVRTGVNVLRFEYLTNGVEFFPGFASASMETFSAERNPDAAPIVVQNATNDNSMPWKQYGSIEQQMNYFEVPLELSYKLVDRKFGIDVIGGMSTLFLDSNDLMVVSEGLTAELGKANNLSSVHFSTNLGVGFRYKFWKTFQANFEPTFKYQFNTFSRNDGGFKPYFIGLYTGVSYRF